MEHEGVQQEPTSRLKTVKCTNTPWVKLFMMSNSVQIPSLGHDLHVLEQGSRYLPHISRARSIQIKEVIQPRLATLSFSRN